MRDNTRVLDVRQLPPIQREAEVFDLFDTLTAGQAFILIAGGDPRSLVSQFQTRYPGAFEWNVLEADPARFRVEILRRSGDAWRTVSDYLESDHRRLDGILPDVDRLVSAGEVARACEQFEEFSCGRPAAVGAASSDLSIGNVRLVEGDSGERVVEVIVKLSSPASDPVTASYATINGTAVAGSDYHAASGSATFARGDVVKRITFRVIGDELVEGDETFDVVLSGASEATIAGTAATVTIVNDDFPDRDHSQLVEVHARRRCRRRVLCDATVRAG